MHPSVGDGVTWGKCRLKTLGRDRSPRREAAEAGTDRTLGSASARSVSSVLRRLRADSLPAGREPECEGPGSLDRPGLRRLLPPGRDQPGPRANLGSLATIRRHDRGPGRGLIDLVSSGTFVGPAFGLIVFVLIVYAFTHIGLSLIVAAIIAAPG